MFFSARVTDATDAWMDTYCIGGEFVTEDNAVISAKDLAVEHAGQDDGFEIEMYKEVYGAKCEPDRALYDPER